MQRRCWYHTPCIPRAPTSLRPASQGLISAHKLRRVLLLAPLPPLLLLFLSLVHKEWADIHIHAAVEWFSRERPGLVVLR